MATITEDSKVTFPEKEEMSRKVTTIEDEDELLFGTMNSDIADALEDRIKVAIAEGVEQLPLLSDTDKANSLVKTIEQCYMRNVDTVEAYGSRNIFTIRHHKPRQRQRILRDCLKDLSLENNNNDEESGLSPAKKAPGQMTYPSKDEIPTPEAAAALQEELYRLKERLTAARSRRNDLLAKQKSIESAIKVSNMAVQSLVVTDDVHGPVSKAIAGGQSIQELTREGKQLIKDLDDSKRERSDDEEETSKIQSTKFSKKKRMSLEEEYQQDRKVLDAHDINSLQALRGMLKQK